MHPLILRAAAAAALLAAPASAAETLTGVYALPEGRPGATATLSAAPEPGGATSLDIAMTQIGRKRPVMRYETELSKQLHVIAVSSDFRVFVHEHGERPGPDGHFHVSMRLPEPGAYHVYADAVPAGLGQQVMRFELKLGGAPAAPAEAPKPGGLESADGAYSARFDPFELRAGQESELSLHLSKGGAPAADVAPFLGVAAHAVFIGAADLTYVHVHAVQASAGRPDAAMAGMKGMEGMGGMSMAPLPAGSRVSPDLKLHVRPPEAGTYLLWIQFMAGGAVRTVPFVVAAR